MPDDFFGLRTHPDGRMSAVLTPHLARYDGRLFGGTAIGLAVVAMETATDRDTIWMTTQFASSAEVGAELSIVAEVLASGRMVSQVRVTAAQEGRVVFAALGAAADLAAARADAAAGQAEAMPVVPPPAQSYPILLRSSLGDAGWHTELDVRVAASGFDGQPDRSCIWVRFRDGAPLTAGRLAFGADLVPLAVARLCGKTGGVSLDNTLRVIRMLEAEWVLVDIVPHGGFGGYGTGTALLWTADGALLGVATQTASLVDDGLGFFGDAVAAVNRGD